MNCPRKIHLRGAKAQDGSFLPFTLDLSLNSVNLQRISCNSGGAVPLRLLAIEESKACKEPCEYERPADSTLECCNMSQGLFAHIYIATDNSSSFIKHYIVVFVDRAKIGRYEDLTAILIHTAMWLRIETERPHFYIYYHGKQPVVNNELAAARNNITRVLRKRLNSYKTGESFCETSCVGRNAAIFTISSSDPYRFNIS
jgi:hypothetical protein